MRDPQDVTPIGYCNVCGGEIYEGERFFAVDDGMIHFEDDCAWNFLKERESGIMAMSLFGFVDRGGFYE